MSNTRSLRNRSSRYSSPATLSAVNGDAAAPVQETIEVKHEVPPRQNEGWQQRRQQQQQQQEKEDRRLGSWIEPTVRNGVPSFEDTKGLERVGVLEHMQPLGVAPNQKLLQKLKVPWSRASLSARATPVYSEGVASPSVEPTSNDAASPVFDSELLLDAPTPPPTIPPPPSQPRQMSAPSPPHQAEVQLSSSHTPQHQPQVQNFPFLMPPMASISQPAEQPSPQIITSPPRGRPAKREVEEMRVYTGADDSLLPAGIANTTARSARASTRHPSGSDSQTHDRFRGCLNNAISRAHRENKPELVAGLRKVMAESGRDEVLTALDNMAKFKGNVRLEQFKVFKRYVKKGIKEHRRSSSLSQLQDYPGPPVPPPKPVAYVSSFHMNTKKPSPVDLQMVNNNAFQPPLRITTNQGVSSHNQAHTKLTLHSPTTVENAPLHLSLDPPSDQHTDLPKHPASRLERESSYSSLSSALSHPEEVYPVSKPESPEQTPESRPTRTLVQRQAPARAASNRATRLSGMGHQPCPPHHGLVPLSELNIKVPTVNADGNDSGQKTKRQKFAVSTLPDYDVAEVEQRRKEFESQTVPNYNYQPVEEVFMRQDVDAAKRRHPPRAPSPYTGPPPPVIHQYPLVPSNAEVSSPASYQGGHHPANGIGKKRDFAEYADDDGSGGLSPAPDSSSSPPPPSRPSRRSVGVPSSRGSTPRLAKSNQQAIGKRPRTMISPRKPRNGASNLATARAGESKDTTVISAADTSELPENDDQCLACGDEGELLLCDGCTNSFHGECLEPQVNPDLIEGNWFCPACEAKRNPGARSSGLMSALIDQVTDLYPRAFNLPHDVRNYFENVKTGEDGEYIEVAIPPAHKKGQARQDNNGGLRPPDYKAERDSKGNTRHCFRCGLTTEGKREMIPCDYCPYEWHLDCLPIPAAVAPKHFGPDGKSGKPWRCPLHIDDDLRGSTRTAGLEIGELGRQPRLRRPRNAVQKEAFIPRRFANNGVVDIALEPEEPELNVKTVEMNGGVFKLPEQQVRLDFIAKARLEFYNDATIPRAKGTAPSRFHTRYWMPEGARFRDDQSRQTPSVDERSSIPDTGSVTVQDPTIIRLRNKLLSEQQAVIGLQQLADSEDSVKGKGQRNTQPDLNELVNRLVTDAPPEAVKQINRTEEEQLQYFISLAQRRLNIVRNNMQPTQPQFLSNGQHAHDARTNGTLDHDHGER